MGGPFPANVSVDFSGISATLINSTSSSLQVQAPNFPGESTADITISSSQGNQTSYAAFTYFQDGSNLTGAVGVLYYLTDTGGYWGSASQSISGGWLTFVDPVDFHWWEFFTPAQENCTGSSYSYGGQFGVYDFGQSGINLGSIYLPWDSTNYKFSSDNISIANNTTYSVTPFSTGLVGFTVNNIARTSQSPIVYAPAISGPTVPYISRYQTFTWSPSGADWIYIRLARLDPFTLNYVDEVNCIAQDDGSFTIEGSQWASWPIEEQIDIYFSRVVEQTSLLPHNNSYGRIVGEYTLLGAAFSQ